MVNRCCAKKKSGERCALTFKAQHRHCHVHRKVIRGGGRVVDHPHAPAVRPVVRPEPVVEPVRVPVPIIEDLDILDPINKNFPELQKLERIVKTRDKLCRTIKREKVIDGKRYIIEIAELLDDNKIGEELEKELETEMEDMKRDCKVECKVCLDEYDLDHIVTCGVSDHTSCLECTKMYITGLINDKKKVSCLFDPTDKCGSIYSDCDIGMVCGEDQILLERYFDYRRVDEATQIATVVDNYHICPFCSKWGIIVDNQFPGDHPQNIKNLTCGNCHIMFCIKCRKAYHGNDTCNKIQTSTEDEVRKTIDRVITEAIIHNCPKCHTKYMKMDGCNLMTCPSCKAYSCYLCDLVIKPKNGQKYWHFSNNKGRCPLYNHKGNTSAKEVTKGNTDYNNKKVLGALKKLVIENIESPEIKSLLVKSITKRGYKINK
jgi:hypothetical protein